MLSQSNARLAAARRLTRRQGRREAGLFLAEGVQAVREALRAGAVRELFATAEAIARNEELLAGADCSEVGERSAAALSETVTPQGLIAVCRAVDLSLDAALAKAPRLVAVLVDANEPGNAGTILRTADAAGAGLVVFAGGVDAYNGKAVRASAGSLFHLDVVLDADVDDVLAAGRAAGLTSLATTAAGDRDLDELIDDRALAQPSMWLFGNEARGLDPAVAAAADLSVRVPIHGRAESLNLSAAAAVCLYASARAQRR